MNAMPGVDPDTVRVAVLGVGAMGSYHVQTLTDSVRGAQVSVINDYDRARATQVAQRCGARVEADPIAAINADDVDAVILASPAAAHQVQVLACLERGIPVLCEKPLTPDPETAYAVVEAEAKLGRSLIQLGFMRRFDPEYVAAEQLINSGGLGRPLLLHCTHRNQGVSPGFDSAKAITDSVVHEVDVTRHLFAEEITGVQVIKAAPTSAAPEGYSDPLVVIFRTDSGRVVTVESFVRSAPGYEVRTEVVGETGSTIFGLDQAGITKTVGTAGDGRWGGPIPAGFVERFHTAYAIELQAFVDAASMGTVTGPGAWDGYAAAAVCAAGVQALESGTVVPVDLKPRPPVP